MVVAPTPAPVAFGPRALSVDGELGQHTIERWQQVMGTPVDGKISTKSSLVSAVQAHLNGLRVRDARGHALVVDGDGDSIRQKNGYRTRTQEAMQRYLVGRVTDGVLSAPVSATVKALQIRLNKGYF